MKSNLLRSLACLALLAAPALADVHEGHCWLDSLSSPGFGFARADLDDESGVVTVLADFQGLSGPLALGRLVGASGETLCTISSQGTAGGVAFGTALLSPADQTQVLLCGTRLVLDTALHPQGEIEGTLSVNLVNYNYELSPAQVSAGHASSATGTGFVMEGLLDEAYFSGQLHGLQGTLTSIEIHRGAWYGQSGPLLLPVTSIGHPNPSLVTFDALIATPTTEERRDIHDGLCYVLVRTTLYPEGELRGQIRPLSLGDRYCEGRPNSASVNGAWVSLAGSPLAADNNVRLQGFDLPHGKVVLPLIGFGTGHAFSPGGLGGVLCVAGAGVGRLNSNVGLTSAQGTFDAQLDLSGFSIGGSVQSLQPGMRLNLQLWYRDPQGPTASNFSAAVSAMFH